MLGHMGQADLPAHVPEQKDYLDYMIRYVGDLYFISSILSCVQTAITVHTMQVFLRVLGSCYHGDPAGNDNPLGLHIFNQLVLTWRQVIKIYTVTQLKCWKSLEPSTSIYKIISPC